MAAKKAGRGRERRAFWTGHVGAWRDGGRSKWAYCRERGLSPASFYRWCQLLDEREPCGARP